MNFSRKSIFYGLFHLLLSLNIGIWVVWWKVSIFLDHECMRWSLLYVICTEIYKCYTEGLTIIVCSSLRIQKILQASQWYGKSFCYYIETERELRTSQYAQFDIIHYLIHISNFILFYFTSPPNKKLTRRQLSFYYRYIHIYLYTCGMPFKDEWIPPICQPHLQ